MKSYIFIFVMLFCGLCSYGQQSYSISTKSPYNIRTSPSVEAEVLGNTSTLSTVQVYEIENGWAKIKYKDSYAYVNVACLKNDTISVAKSKSSSKVQDEIEGTKLELFMIFTLACVLTVFLIIRLKTGKLKDRKYIANLVCFNLLCFFEWCFVLEAKNNSLWILDPNYVSGLFFINLIIGLFVVIVQSLSFYFTIDSIRTYTESDFNLYIGLWSIPGGIVFSIVTGILWGEYAVMVVFLVFVLCQLYQTISIFKNVLKSSNVIQACIATFTYIFGFVTTLIITSFILCMYLGLRLFKSRKIIEK